MAGPHAFLRGGEDLANGDVPASFAAAIPERFTADERAQVQDAAGAALTYARDLSTERSYSAKVAGFRRFLTAMYDNPTEQIWFDADDIMMYMSCWVNAGFSARTIKNNLTALRGYARRQRL